MPALTPAQAYAFRRALMGKDWPGVKVDSFTEMLATSAKANRDPDALGRFFGPVGMSEIFAADPDTPPLCDLPESEVPDLPPSARLTPAQERQAESVGQWEREFVSLTSKSINITPLSFIQGAALWLGAVAIGRRLYVASPWGREIHPNLYLLICAVSTYYAKTAAHDVAGRFAYKAMWHMIMPEPGSPENFIRQLAGKMNLDDLNAEDKVRFSKAIPFAAQRGIIRDEVSGLFKSFSRDYMAGMKERIMQCYDAQIPLEFSTNSQGVIIVRDVALNILGASTPAEMALSLCHGDWSNGTLARFALLTPEVGYVERPPLQQSIDDGHLIERLQRLHELLPGAGQGAMGEPKPAERWSLIAPIWPDVDRYFQALRAMTAPDAALDDRLRSLYGRLHVQALKIAIILAGQDWADNPRRGPRPEVSPAHWYRGVQIAEQWRASAHRFLVDLSENAEVQSMNRLKRAIERLGEPTKSQLINTTRMPVSQIDQTMKVLIESGEVEEGERPSPRGKPAKVYRTIRPA